jgi:hypothetical protein
MEKKKNDLTHLFKAGQKVRYRNDDFDAVEKFSDGIVKEVHPDHIIVNLTETDVDMWCEEGFNMDCVYPDYNFQEAE